MRLKALRPRANTSAEEESQGELAQGGRLETEGREARSPLARQEGHDSQGDGGADEDDERYGGYLRIGLAEVGQLDEHRYQQEGRDVDADQAAET